MKSFTVQIIVIILAVFLGNLFADENTINWAYRNYPPYFIDEGEFKEQGYGDIAYDIFTQSYLNNFTHRKVHMNIHRFLEQAKEFKNVCAMAVKKTPEREKYLYFSIPAEISLPHRIYFRQEDNLQLESCLIDGFLSLDSLLKHFPNLKLGIESGRSYGSEKDKIINRYLENGAGIYQRKGTDSRRMIEMLLSKRVDFIIEYPRAIGFIYQYTHDSLPALQSFPIKEGYKVDPAYCACSKTEQGKEVINTINEALVKEIPKDRYRLRAKAWLDEQDFSQYKSAYNAIFNKYLNNPQAQ